MLHVILDNLHKTFDCAFVQFGYAVCWCVCVYTTIKSHLVHLCVVCLCPKFVTPTHPALSNVQWCWCSIKLRETRTTNYSPSSSGHSHKIRDGAPTRTQRPAFVLGIGWCFCASAY